MAKKIIKLTEADLAKLVSRVIKEQSETPDPKRIAFFDGLAKQISSTLVGKKLFFGNIGVLKDNNLLIQKYEDRNHAINLENYPVKELNLYFAVRRTEEDLYPNEKYGKRPWYGTLSITANFVNGKMVGNPDVKLYRGAGNNTDFSTEMKPSKPWTWDMVGGANLWAKAGNPPR